MSADRDSITASEVGDAVRDARRAAGITQQELADRIKVTRQWVIRLEQGRDEVRMSDVQAVCNELGLMLRAEFEVAT